MKRTIRLTLLMACAAWMLVACGDKESTSKTSATPAAPAAGGTAAAAAPAVAPSAAAAVATTAPTTAAAAPKNPRLILATTTSTVDTGLLEELVPMFEKATGYKVVTLSLGSGQALATAERGEADVLLVHSPDAERQFMSAGHGLDRRLVMHNDFVIVGPPDDPAGIKGGNRAGAAMQQIAARGVPFISRGDNSGTQALELKLWRGVSIDPKSLRGYVESGTGMGQTLQIAGDRKAYTISDRGTYLAQRRNLQLDILVEGDAALFNVYHVIRVHPNKNDRINSEGAVAFANFVVSAPAQALVGTFGKERFGAPLFVPDAGKPDPEG